MVANVKNGTASVCCTNQIERVQIIVIRLGSSISNQYISQQARLPACRLAFIHSRHSSERPLHIRWRRHSKALVSFPGCGQSQIDQPRFSLRLHAAARRFSDLLPGLQTDWMQQAVNGTDNDAPPPRRLTALVLYNSLFLLRLDLLLAQTTPLTPRARVLGPATSCCTGFSHSSCRQFRGPHDAHIITRTQQLSASPQSCTLGRLHAQSLTVTPSVDHRRHASATRAALLRYRTPAIALLLLLLPPRVAAYDA